MAQVRRKYRQLSVRMDERMRRQWAATEATQLGWGGVSAVGQATGLARNTIMAGQRELARPAKERQKELLIRVRHPGGGRKPLTTQDPELLKALERLIDCGTRGHPESPLRWTCKSTAKLAGELCRRDHPVSDRTVAHLLKKAGYSLQSNRKTQEGASHPDRDEQFEYIGRQVMQFQRREQPAVSVDTKKKELVGHFKNAGREWRPQGKPVEVKVHDFPEAGRGKAIPYGVYDLANNEGWVSVGIDHDTARFAAASLRRWWKQLGARRFPAAKELLITADGGGSNSSRNRLWKVALQELADDLGLRLSVCHFPPGTSKWNKIEHRLFSFITNNWRGRPLTSYEVIVNLIASTTTKTGLIVKAAIDTNQYETGVSVSDDELARVHLTPAKFHGEWNYVIEPR
jgi:Rhodopirellula transposase DDE domain